jgi:signal transduction histidine kinase
VTSRPRADAEPTPPPPLTRWQWTWRNLVALAISLVVWAPVVRDQWAGHRTILWLEVLAGAVAFVAYQYRRRYPLAIAIGIQALASVATLAAGPATMAIVSLATRRLWREIVPVGVLSMVSGVVYFTVNPAEDDPLLLEIAFNLLFTVVVIAIGMYIGARRELVATLQDRAERAESEQALRVAQARANERARIAREMHDVLAHRISLLAMHAGALEYRTDLTPEEMARAAGVIQENAHRALTDLREILGLLRDDPGDDEPPEAPQPTLRDLSALITEERNAGAKIRLHTKIRESQSLPDSVGRSAYRILQEGLTNARKHAPGTEVDVIVAGSPGRSLLLLVRNPLPVGRVRAAPGAKLGLVGLSERATLAGGTLDHRVTRHGHFVVRARLPWPG